MDPLLKTLRIASEMPEGFYTLTDLDDAYRAFLTKSGRFGALVDALLGAGKISEQDAHLLHRSAAGLVAASITLGAIPKSKES